MNRTPFLLLVVALALVLSVFVAPNAFAQDESPCRFLPASDTVALDEVIETEVVDDAEPAPADLTADSADTAGIEAGALLDCAEPAVYPGPFTNTPVVPSSPHVVPDASSDSVQSPTTATEVADAPSASLAHSGSEIFVLAYLGTGMLAFGAVALGMRRTAFQR